MQTDKLKIDRSVADHLLRTYRAFLEGFSLLVIHHSFGNPISIEESFEISLNVLLKGIEPYGGGKEIVIYELKDTKKQKKIFDGWQETMIDSCIQQVMEKYLLLI